jgi:hypothetical protein
LFWMSLSSLSLSSGCPENFSEVLLFFIRMGEGFEFLGYLPNFVIMIVAWLVSHAPIFCLPLGLLSVLFI